MRAWGIAFLESKRKKDFLAALEGQRYRKDKNRKRYFVWVGICLKMLQFFYNKHCNQECHAVIEKERWWWEYVNAENTWEKLCWMWSKVEPCIKVWYSNSRTCYRQSVHSRLLSSFVPQCPISHCSECEHTRDTHRHIWREQDKYLLNTSWMRSVYFRFVMQGESPFIHYRLQCTNHACNLLGLHN